jgi:thiamine biosynthesis lipoprotein
MKETRLLMGMPVTVEVLDQKVTQAHIDDIYAYFEYIDETFSTYKESSEITAINDGRLALSEASHDMKTIFRLAEQTREETYGYFDILRNGKYDPSGIVKGWAIHHAAQRLKKQGFRDFYVDAGGDIEVYGKNEQGLLWQVGIRNPFNIEEIVKVLAVTNCGVATSGTYVRGEHIYNPKSETGLESDVVSLTVIGRNIYEADRFATAAFAMGSDAIYFIESLNGFEGYAIDRTGRATMTTDFGRYVSHV